MEFLLKNLYFIILFRFGESQMSAEDVLDMVSSRVNHISLRLSRVTRGQKIIEKRLNDIVNELKHSDQPEDSGNSEDNEDNENSVDVDKTDIVEESMAMKKAFASEKEYIRVQVGNIEAMIAQLNETLQSMSKSVPTENSVPEAFETRIQSMEKTIAELGRSSNKLETKILAVEEDISAEEIKTDGLKNKLDYMTTNLSDLVLATERNVSFYAQFRPPANYARMLKNRIIPFDHVAFNDGSGYNMTSGIFTAPKSGVYQFIFFVEGWKKDDDFSCVTASAILAVNEVGVVAALAVPKHTEQSILSGNTYISYMSKGQQAWVQTGPNCDMYSIFGFRTSFSGVLLY